MYNNSIGIFILSSGRMAYLRETLKSIQNTPLARHSSITILINCNPNSDQIKRIKHFCRGRFSKEIEVLEIEGNDHFSLLHEAFKNSLLYSVALLTEDDHFFDKSLTTEKIYAISELSKTYSQVSFSGYPLGQEQEHASLFASATLHIDRTKKFKLLNNSPFFALGGFISSKENREKIVKVLDKNRELLVGLEIEYYISRKLHPLVGVTVVSDKAMNFQHIGFIGTTQFLRIGRRFGFRLANQLLSIQTKFFMLFRTPLNFFRSSNLWLYLKMRQQIRIVAKHRLHSDD